VTQRFATGALVRVLWYGCFGHGCFGSGASTGPRGTWGVVADRHSSPDSAFHSPEERWNRTFSTLFGASTGRRRTDGYGYSVGVTRAGEPTSVDAARPLVQPFAHRPPLCVKDLFSRCDLLTPAGRVALAEHLHIPGRRPAVFADELRDVPLILEREHLAETARLIGHNIRGGFGAGVTARTVGELVPLVARVDGPIRLSALATRQRDRLAREQITTWAEVSYCTVGTMLGWVNVGEVFVTSLIGAAVAVAVAAIDCPVVGSEDLTLAGLLEAILAAAGDFRDRAAFEHLVTGQMTIAGVASTIGISFERVRQMRRRAEVRVRDAVEGHPAVAEIAAALAASLGRAAPLAGLPASLDEVGIDLDSNDSRTRLLLWLAGPYRAVNGNGSWIATDPQDLAAETRDLLAEDGGVRPFDHVVKSVAHLGLLPDHAEAWIVAQPVRIVDDLVVLTTGTDAEIAERALSALGRSASLEELTGWIDRAGDPSRLWVTLNNDRRFVRTGPRCFELAEWGSVAYAPQLSLYDDDLPPSGDGGGGGDGLDVRVAVDAATFAGDGGALPAEWAWTLGLTPGAGRSLASRFGPLSVTYDGAAASRGSLRPIARAIGADYGDVIVLRLRPSHTEIDVSLFRQNQQSITDRLGAPTSWTPPPT
jgi:hypothetical protein